MQNQPSGQASGQSAGFNCPRCQGFIKISLEGLLQSNAVICQQCGMALELDVDRSAAAIAELRKLADGTAGARQLLSGSDTRAQSKT